MDGKARDVHRPGPHRGVLFVAVAVLALAAGCGGANSSGPGHDGGTAADAAHNVQATGPTAQALPDICAVLRSAKQVSWYLDGAEFSPDPQLSHGFHKPDTAGDQAVEQDCSVSMEPTIDGGARWAGDVDVTVKLFVAAPDSNDHTVSGVQQAHDAADPNSEFGANHGTPRTTPGFAGAWLDDTQTDGETVYFRGYQGNVAVIINDSAAPGDQEVGPQNLNQRVLHAATIAQAVLAGIHFG